MSVVFVAFTTNHLYRSSVHLTLPHNERAHKISAHSVSFDDDVPIYARKRSWWKLTQLRHSNTDDIDESSNGIRHELLNSTSTDQNVQTDCVIISNDVHQRGTKI
jgi:hypothetical protein